MARATQIAGAQLCFSRRWPLPFVGGRRTDGAAFLRVLGRVGGERRSPFSSRKNEKRVKVENSLTNFASGAGIREYTVTRTVTGGQ
jgi:hypothetical protein